MPAMAEMTDRQSRFFFLFNPSSPDIRATLRPLVDADVAEAADSVARTLDTASRGVIYESTPQSLTAQELARELRRARSRKSSRELKGLRSPLERDAARALSGTAGRPPRGFDRRQRAPGFLSSSGGC